MISFIQWIQGFSTPLLDQFFLTVTNLANEMLFVFIVVILYWCISKEKGFAMVSSLLFSVLINLDFKQLWKVPRPFMYSNVIQKDLQTGYGYSFPSGHSQITASFFTSLWLQFRRHWLLLLGSSLTLLIGFSRIYLGVHTPLDVGCGILFGVFTVYIIQSLVKRMLLLQKQWFAYFLLIPGVLGMICTDDPDIAKVTFLLLGFLLGSCLESKYVQFSVKAPLAKQILKVSIGLCVILVIQYILKLFGDILWLHYLRYFFIGFAITFICPWLFKKMKVSFA